MFVAGHPEGQTLALHTETAPQAIRLRLAVQPNSRRCEGKLLSLHASTVAEKANEACGSHLESMLFRPPMARMELWPRY